MEKNAKWTQDVAVNKLKDTIEPKKQIYWQRTGRRLSEELVTGFSDARKKNFAVRNLTESELNFLLEYVCNSWSGLDTVKRLANNLLRMSFIIVLTDILVNEPVKNMPTFTVPI